MRFYLFAVSYLGVAIKVASTYSTSWGEGSSPCGPNDEEPRPLDQVPTSYLIVTPIVVLFLTWMGSIEFIRPVGQLDSWTAGQLERPELDSWTVGQFHWHFFTAF